MVREILEMENNVSGARKSKQGKSMGESFDTFKAEKAKARSRRGVGRESKDQLRKPGVYKQR